MLPAPNRLRARSDFTSVVRGPGSIRYGSSKLVVHANRASSSQCSLLEPGPPPRIGFVVSKVVGGAVVRNRVKRRLRAICTAELTGIPDGVDIVIRAQSSAAQATSAELSRTLKPLLDRTIRNFGGVA